MKRLRWLLALLMLLPAVSFADLVNCAPGTPCNKTTGPSATNTGDQAWQAFGKINENILTFQTQLNAAIAITGPIKGNGTTSFAAATASDLIALWTGCSSGSPIVRFDGTCGTAGTGSLNASGSPATGGLAKWTGPLALTSADLSGDCATSGSMVLTCSLFGGKALSFAASFSTSGAFAMTITATAASNATLPAGNSLLGYMSLPVSNNGVAHTGNYTAALTDNGQQIPMRCTSPCTASIPPNSGTGAVVFPFTGGGGSCLVWNVEPGSAIVTLTITTDTMTYYGDGTTVNRTLTAPAMVTVCKYDATHWAVLPGPGVSYSLRDFFGSMDFFGEAANEDALDARRAA